MHIYNKSYQEDKMKYSEPKKVVTVTTYSKGRNLIIWTTATRTTEENNLFLPHGSCMDYNSLFTKLVIAKRNNAGYFMKFKVLIIQSYL